MFKARNLLEYMAGLANDVSDSDSDEDDDDAIANLLSSVNALFLVKLIVFSQIINFNALGHM